MFEFLAFFSIGALLWSLFALVFAVFPGNRMLRLKHAAIAFVAFIGTSVVAAIVQPSPEETAAKAQARAVQRAEREEAERVAAAERKQKNKEDYVDRLSTEIEIVKAFNARDFSGDAKTVVLGAAALDAFASSYQEGKQYELTEEQEALRQSFKKVVSQKQRESFPILRDAYGPALRSALWEADGKAKTFGAGYRTIEIINAAFAANRNIKAIHEEMYPTLMKLRFTRAQYKWLDADVEYSYYAMNPPKDDELVTWTRNGVPLSVD